jgi:VCBS repeat protein/hemolysin type calcium-binding protein
MKILAGFSSILLCFTLLGCKIEITVPEGGRVVSESGTYECFAGQVCAVDVVDIYFNEKFEAIPDDGWVFRKWKSRPGYFCGGLKDTCDLSTILFKGNDVLISVLQLDIVLFLEPSFRKDLLDSIGQNYAPTVILTPPESESYLHAGSFEVIDINGDGLGEVIFSGVAGEDGYGPAPPYFFSSTGDGSMKNITSSIFKGPVPYYEAGVLRFRPADFNGDGRLDFYFELQGPELPPRQTHLWPGGQDRLFLADQQGMLVDMTATNLPAFSNFSHGSSVADFDGDGDVDIWVNTLTPHNHATQEPRYDYLLHNDGSGNFTIVAGNSWDQENPVVGSDPILPALGKDQEGFFTGGWWSVPIDANGDGHMDLHLTRSQDGFIPGLPFFTNLLLLNDGTGQFNKLPGDSYPSVGCVASPNKPDPDACRGDPNPATQQQLVYDLNRDGLDDMVLHQTIFLVSPDDPTLPQLTSLQILISNGDGTFRDETAERHPGGPTQYRRYFFQLHDLDGDGHKDIFSNTDFSENDIRINDGEGFFRRLDTDWVEAGWNWAVLDVDGDGGTDFFIDRQGYELAKMSLPYGPNHTGTPDDDRLIGGAHNNIFKGLAGWDLLDGGLGADKLIGGLGNDRLIGGKGSDSYVFEIADLEGHDTIIDKLGNDKLLFKDFGLGEVTAARQGKKGELILEFAAGGSITIKNQFSGGSYAIERLQVGEDIFIITTDPAFDNGNIEELLGI